MPWEVSVGELVGDKEVEEAACPPIALNLFDRRIQIPVIEGYSAF